MPFALAFSHDNLPAPFASAICQRHAIARKNPIYDIVYASWGIILSVACQANAFDI